MDSKTSYIRAFNCHFFAFLDRAAEIVDSPGNINIIVTRGSADLLKRANPSVLIKAWYSQVALKYSREIQSGDFNFFTDKNYETDLSEFSDKNKIVQMIDKLRACLKTINDEQKHELSKFVQELSFVSIQYASIR
jgi:hypothetical protein